MTTVMQPEADAPADNITTEFEGSLTPASISNPAHQASAQPPPILPISDMPTTGTPAGFPFSMLAFNPKHKKWDHSPDSTPNDQCGKRAHIETKEANISSGQSTSPIQPEFGNGVKPKTRSSETVPAASHSP